MQINVELNELLKAIDNTFDDEVDVISNFIKKGSRYSSKIFKKSVQK